MRTGSTPLNGRFASNSCWLSSSVKSGATRTATPPASALFADEGSGGRLAAGLTLKREPEHATDAIDAQTMAASVSQRGACMDFELTLITRAISHVDLVAVNFSPSPV